jgi:hypothetical protein
MAFDIEQPPVVAGLAAFNIPTDVEVDGTQVAFNITNTDPIYTAGGALLVYVSEVVSPGVRFFKGPFKYIGRVNGGATPPTNVQAINIPADAGAGGVGVRYARFIGTDATYRPTMEIILRATPV